MASVEQRHWWDFLPIWWGVIVGAVTAVLGGIVRVERISFNQAQQAKDIADVKTEVRDLKDIVSDVPVMQNDIRWIREHLEKSK